MCKASADVLRPCRACLAGGEDFPYGFKGARSAPRQLTGDLGKRSRENALTLRGAAAAR